MTTHRLHSLLRHLAGPILGLAAGILHAQSFDTGSDGNLGDLRITNSVTLDLPADGRIKVRSLVIDAGNVLSFRANAANTPVYILSQGDVRIAGQIYIAGDSVDRSRISGGLGGPGAFRGGNRASDGMDAGVNVRSPLFYMHWDMDAGASRFVPGEHAERAVYLTEGAIEVAGQALKPGQMAVLGKGDARVTAQAPSTVMVLGGEPIGERFIFWNFVSSSKARLEAAKEDWKQGRMKLPDGDDQEFTPLPAT
jgi:hypothetical protein